MKHLPVPPVQSCLFCGEDRWTEGAECPKRPATAEEEALVHVHLAVHLRRLLSEGVVREERLKKSLRSALMGPPAQMSTGGDRVGLPALVPLNSAGMRLVLDRLSEVCSELSRVSPLLRLAAVDAAEQ
jgi:hypothetical protein